MPPKNEYKNETEIIRLLEQNAVLVRENNVLLKKLHRNSVIEMWLRILWYAILFGLPFALYFYILDPYFEAFGMSFEKLQNGMNEVPWSKIFSSMGRAE
jgi:hypothetical protein